jgi:hypothetical protein
VFVMSPTRPKMGVALIPWDVDASVTQAEALPLPRETEWQNVYLMNFGFGEGRTTRRVGKGKRMLCRCVTALLKRCVVLPWRCNRAGLCVRHCNVPSDAERYQAC